MIGNIKMDKRIEPEKGEKCKRNKENGKRLEGREENRVNKRK